MYKNVEIYGNSVEFYEIAALSQSMNIENILKKFSEMTKLNEGIILDIGAGTGKTTLEMAKLVPDKSLIALEPSAYMRIAFMAKLMESKDKLSQITILPYSIEQYSFEEEISGILCMGVLGHLNMEERKHLWKILDDKLKKNVPILIEVLDPRFLEIKKGTRIAVAFQGRLRYETYVTDVKYSSGKRWEWLLTYRVSYGEKIINEVNSPMWWNYDRIEDILTELAQVNFRGIKLGETLLLAIKN